MYLFKATLREPSFTLFLWQCKAFDAVFFINVIISVCFSCFFMMHCMLINSNTGVNVTHPSSFFNISGIFALTVSWVIRELKQRRRWRLRKRHLKSEVALLQTLSRLFHLFQFTKCWQFSLEMNSKELYQSSGKENQSRCLVFTFSIKRENRHFHIVVKQWR